MGALVPKNALPPPPTSRTFADENGALHTVICLKPDEEVEVLDPPSPALNYDRFMRGLLEAQARTLGIPSRLLYGDSYRRRPLVRATTPRPFTTESGRKVLQSVKCPPIAESGRKVLQSVKCPPIGGEV